MYSEGIYMLSSIKFEPKSNVHNIIFCLILHNYTFMTVYIIIYELNIYILI
jgi:hypothetical protein